MRKLLFILLTLLCLNCRSQFDPNMYHPNELKPGTAMMISGFVTIGVSFTISPSYTWQGKGKYYNTGNGGNSNGSGKMVKQSFWNQKRSVPLVMGIGLTFTGIISNIMSN